MTRNSIIGFSFALLAAVVGLAPAANAQDEGPENRPPQNNAGRHSAHPGDGRDNMLRRLGLSEDQIQQIRAINMERRPDMAEAHKRVREATRALDAAIYADKIDEADVQQRIKDVQVAQAEVARLRFMTELAVRQVLTPEQLVRFREMRQRFERSRDDFQGGRRAPGKMPIRRGDREKEAFAPRNAPAGTAKPAEKRP